MIKKTTANNRTETEKERERAGKWRGEENRNGMYIFQRKFLFISKVKHTKKDHVHKNLTILKAKHANTIKKIIH